MAFSTKKFTDFTQRNKANLLLSSFFVGYQDAGIKSEIRVPVTDLLNNVYNQTQTIVNTNSSTWGNASTSYIANSGKFQSTYETVNTLSAGWGGLDVTKWNSTYTTVYETSASWTNTYNTVVDLSGQWSDTTSTMNSNSSTWDSTSLIVSNNKPSWDNNVTTVSQNSGTWDSTYTTVLANSAQWATNGSDVISLSSNWQNTYSTVLTNSGSWDVSNANAYTHENFLPLSGGNMTGKLFLINPTTTDAGVNIGIGNVAPISAVTGDLWGTTAGLFYRSSPTITRSLAVQNGVNSFSRHQVIDVTEAVPALRVTQRGTGNAFVVEDETTPDNTSFIINNTGSVGIGLSSIEDISNALTVVGNISSTGIIYASGGNSAVWNTAYNTSIDLVTSSHLWNSTYTTVNANSSLWVNDVNVNILSGNWENTYTTVQTHSGDWSYQGTDIKELTGNWESTYTTMKDTSSIWVDVYTITQQNSSSWGGQDTNITAISSNWENTYTTVYENSAFWGEHADTAVRDLTANWENTYSLFYGNSSKWDDTYNTVHNVSGNWSSVYSVVNVNSGAWEYQGTDIKELTGNWENTYNIVNTNSGNWSGTYTLFGQQSASNLDVQSIVTAGSGDWIDTHTVVYLFSAGWGSPIDTARYDDTYTTVYDLSGGWQTTKNNVDNGSPIWYSTYDTVITLSGGWQLTKEYLDDNQEEWNDTTTTVNTFSSNWDSAYINQQNYLPLSGGRITGDTFFNTNVTIYGDLSCTGTQTFANTVFTTTSALSVFHIGEGDALWVGNDGPGDIATFYDIDQDIEILHIGGKNSINPNVGVNISNPNKDFTVNGEISASGNIWTSGQILSGDQELLSILNNSLLRYDNTTSTVLSNSGAWDIAYTNLVTNSAAYLSGVDLSFLSVSANWNNAYTYIQSTSSETATRDFVYSNFVHTTGGTVTGNLSAKKIFADTLQLSGVSITGNLTTASSITGNNLFIEISINGASKYLRLYDVE